MRYTSIATPEFTYFYATESEDKALQQFANTVGYDSYADLAETIGKTVDKAKAELVIRLVTASDVIKDIIDETLDSDVVEDGASDPFKTSEAWADWCLHGMTGDEIRSFAKSHELRAYDLVEAARDAFCERDIDDINAPFAERTERADDTV